MPENRHIVDPGAFCSHANTYPVFLKKRCFTGEDAHFQRGRRCLVFIPNRT
jgi:hypothetical protein